LTQQFLNITLQSFPDLVSQGFVLVINWYEMDVWGFDSTRKHQYPEIGLKNQT
tara:strand:- start:154 stop:312 length:159 start_codon:yes stop_codon:yes gene_type:complete